MAYVCVCETESDLANTQNVGRHTPYRRSEVHIDEMACAATTGDKGPPHLALFAATGLRRLLATSLPPHSACSRTRCVGVFS